MRRGKDCSFVDGAISLLQHTSSIIDVFTNKCVLNQLTDIRLSDLHSFYAFCKKWEDGVQPRNFMSTKLWFDLQAMCLGFQSMATIKLTKFPQAVMKPAIINQDCVENHFCQIRACNGQNNNPTYRQQESTQNSIRYGQTVISRKSNAGVIAKSSACSIPI